MAATDEVLSTETLEITANDAAETNRSAADRLGRAVFTAAVIAAVAISMPVIWRGAPLADDFNNCIAPLELGLEGFLTASWDRLGIIRSARFLEILLTTGVCRALPFGVAIVVPLVLTLTLALLVRGLLRDLDTPPPWPNIAGALWLLQPLGTESSLWPAALHVPLGLSLVVVALRLHRRGRHAWAALTGVGAALSVEQAIFALPLAAWLVAAAPQKRRAAGLAVFAMFVVLGAFALWPGSDPRLRVGVAERLGALINDPFFYIAFPAVGLGFHSIPLAVLWALPWSVILLAVGASLGIAAARRLPSGRGIALREGARWMVAVAALVALVNAPVLLNVPHQGSPRLFTPTWLILVISIAVVAVRLRWRRPLLIGAAGGVFAAGAVLSLALSVAVRLATADFNAQSAHLLAASAPDGAQVAVCGVRRTVTTPAPRGAFAVHELVYEWAAEDAVAYYTGRKITFQLAGELWQRSCPDSGALHRVVQFDELLAATRR